MVLMTSLLSPSPPMCDSDIRHKDQQGNQLVLAIGKIQAVRGTRSTACGIALLFLAWGAWIVIAFSPAAAPRGRSTTTESRQRQIAHEEALEGGAAAAGREAVLRIQERGSEEDGVLLDPEVEEEAAAVRAASFPLPSLPSVLLLELTASQAL